MNEERPIWGIHMEMHHQMRPVTEGFVAIGWPKIGDLSKLSPTRDAFKKALVAAYPTTKPGAVPVAAGTLFKFANEMKKGDWVIYHQSPIEWSISDWCKTNITSIQMPTHIFRIVSP